MEFKIFDLKSFYASVECADRNLDPLTTNLVVADVSRTEKMICLAVSPSSFDVALAADPALELSYITAPPRMSRYMAVSSSINGIYLKYIAPEDIVAKHVPADKDGVRIAELDERRYRELLWTHEPLTDFWRIGRGYAKKLQENGMFTMGDIARCSIGSPRDYYNEDLLYKLFGVNAELLIDHSWGWEPTTIADIKAYKPESSSLGSGQVLHCPYDYEKAKLVVREMTDLLVLDLVDKGLMTDQLVLTIGYDIENVSSGRYQGPVTTDHYGRKIPKHAHGTGNLKKYSSSTREIIDCMMSLYDQIVDKSLLVRRVTICANHVIPEDTVPTESGFEQLDLFTDYAAAEEKQKQERAALEKERKLQQAALSIKKKFGKNAILKGMNLQEGATARDRNSQVGGHRAGEDDMPKTNRKGGSHS